MPLSLWGESGDYPKGKEKGKEKALRLLQALDSYLHTPDNSFMGKRDGKDGEDKGE